MPTLTNTQKYNAVVLPVPLDGKRLPDVLSLLPETQSQYTRLINSERLFVGKVFQCFEYGYHFLLLPYTSEPDLLADFEAGAQFIDAILADNFGAYYLHAEQGTAYQLADETLSEFFKKEYRGVIQWQRPKTRG